MGRTVSPHHGHEYFVPWSQARRQVSVGPLDTWSSGRGISGSVRCTVFEFKMIDHRMRKEKVGSISHSLLKYSLADKLSFCTAASSS